MCVPYRITTYNNLCLQPPHFGERKPETGVEALEHALLLEHQVTESIRKLIIDCEDGAKEDTDPTKFNDYHVSGFRFLIGLLV